MENGEYSYTRLIGEACTVRVHWVRGLGIPSKLNYNVLMFLDLNVHMHLPIILISSVDTISILTGQEDCLERCRAGWGAREVQGWVGS